ncbi:hypothetical protein [Hoeflea sp.]|uniref:hypothetical protein n=1 Tax=Hoeflea sp. TaxID=1940281 RepID=UPI0019ADDE3C|nr:hypothetical protein [Hoeflea sp.]MBC7283916.1 hypothetical protein [Hoeflea sp.]
MSIDATAIVWYAAICGALSAFAPSFGGRGLRLAVGAVVGVAAATVLPFVRSMIG